MGILDKVKKNNSPQDVDDAEAVRSAQIRKIEDVLEILQIPATFEVPSEVFMSEDLKDVDFDIQIPHGYDQGQVMRFVTQSRASVRFYVDLLRKRNEDVAKLASIIDKLQVDANNLRFENEIANGISVMPTMGSDDLENQLMEAKLHIRNLEDQLKKAPAVLPTVAPTSPTGVTQENYEEVLDELSLMKRQNENLEDSLLTLKNRLALIDDDEDEELAKAIVVEPALSEEEYKKLGIDDISSPEDVPLPSGDLGMARSIENELPEPPGDAPRSLGVSYDYDDDDDTLDELMKNLREG